MNEFVRVAPPGVEQADEPGMPLPPSWCRLCWRELLVHRGGVWMAEHIGPFDSCLHSCHDGESFLESTS